jgi:aspartate kinase
VLFRPVLTGFFYIDMIVRKFGGSSVGTAERMQGVFALVSSSNEKQLVVLSAVGGITDNLVGLCKSKSLASIEELRSDYLNFVEALLADQENQSKAMHYIDGSLETVKNALDDNLPDLVLAQGELVSTYLFALYAEEQGQKVQLLYAPDLINLDSEEHVGLTQLTLNLESALDPEVDLYIAQGFICKDHLGHISNLKRGGSDYSAALFGAALNVGRIEIWSDIDGVHNNDPRFVSGTSSIEELSYDEAAEMAYFGAKVLHPSTLLPAKERRIPVVLKNTLRPEQLGTIIRSSASDKGIKAIAAKDGITAIRIRSDRMLLAFGFLSKVFEVFSKHRTPIDMITTSEVAVSMTIDDLRNLESIVSDLQHYGHVEVEHNQCIVSVIGRMETSDSGYGQQIFDALEHIPIRMISYGASQNNVSLLVNSEDKVAALNALHKSILV